MQLEHDVEIARPPAQVFAYLTDPTKLPEWQESVLEVRRDSAEPVAAGTRWTEVRSTMGRRMEADVEVTALEPERRFAVRSASGPVRFQADHTLEPTAGGTRVRVLLEGEFQAAAKLAGPLISRQAKKILHGDFDRLKQRLEGS